MNAAVLANSALATPHLITMALQGVAAVLVGAGIRDAWRWLSRRRSQHQHPARHRQTATPGQPSRVRVVGPNEQVHDWAQDEDTP